MKNVIYAHSSVHVQVPEDISQNVISWGRSHLSDDEIFVKQNDPTYGREDDIHITVLYGIHSETPDEIISLASNFGPIKVELGLTGVFYHQPKFDVLIINVKSDGLSEINKQLRTVPSTNLYGEEYKPHVTIAYMKKGCGKHYKGLDLWSGIKFTCESLIFSSRNGSRTRIEI